MVSRTRFRTVLTTLGLYVGAALLIGYFYVHAYSGNHGLNAKQDLIQQETELTAERQRLQAEREAWEHRVLLLRPGGIDPDLLDERAREELDYAHPHELILMRKRP